MNSYETFIHKSRYARWIEDEGRRESWEETVDRYMTLVKDRIPKEQYHILDDVKQMIMAREVMPSMRALMTAGLALERDNVAGYNCAYIKMDRVRAFDELMYILLCGTGVGFSVERQYINNLPTVSEEFHETDTTVHVRDSKIGWATATKEIIAMLYSGQVPKWDVSKVRPAGARLKTFGGRASGPEPLVKLFKNLVRIFSNAAGRKLNSLEVHDICCYIADAVVVGGVRRSALISLSNLSDVRMAGAKTGEWYYQNGQRANANNSVAYTEKPELGTFIKEWLNLYESKSGERGIFYRTACDNQAARTGRREPYPDFGCNPCSEIILRDRQLCNLTEAVVRPDDDVLRLKRKLEVATILGTVQSTLTDFRYLSKEWKKNCEEERLLGVSLTGIMDNELTRTVSDDTSKMLEELREHCVQVNKVWSEILGINGSVAITTVKPSGTVSQLVGASSGIHPAQYAYYWRTVRQSVDDPLNNVLKEQGIRWEVDATNPAREVFYFPMKAPEGTKSTEQVSALEQLELWKQYQLYWCEHKPSMTVYVRENEWLAVATWVWENFDIVSGISFFPMDDHVYEQAPYIKLTKEQYEEAIAHYPKDIDWSGLAVHEVTDTTIGSQEFACTGNACEIL